MNTNNNEDNFKRYQVRLAKLQQEGNLVAPPELPIDQLISLLAAEGNKLLQAEPGAKPPKIKPPQQKPDNAKLEASLAAMSKNPYIRARGMILEKLSTSRRKEIMEMEKNGNINNTKYQEFLNDVTKLGDSLSEQQ